MVSFVDFRVILILMALNWKVGISKLGNWELYQHLHEDRKSQPNVYEVADCFCILTTSHHYG
jgi:hypothetical protein